MNSLLFEPKYRDMQPATEDLLGSGHDLKNGMVVLVESPSKRDDPSGPSISQRAADHLKLNNRWCEVSEVRIQKLGFDEAAVSFVGIYADGTKRLRQFSVDNAWFVKKDSLPKAETDVDEKGSEDAAVSEKEMVEEAKAFADYAEAPMRMFSGTEETTLEAAPAPVSFKLELSIVGEVTPETLFEAFLKQIAE